MGGLEAWLLDYLVNSLWQVPLVFGVAWVCARMVRPSGPAAEHRLWVTALLLESMLPGVPAGSWSRVRAMLAFVRGSGVGGDGTVSIAMGAGFAAQLGHVPGWLATAACVVYGTALVYFGARLGWGLWRIGRLRRESTAVALTAEAGAFWEQCSRQFGVREVELAASADVRGPMTVGVWRKLVLVPAEMVSRVDGEAMRTVMAHELAHVARRDFAWNLLYEIVAVPVLYHPVFRLTQQRMRESREAVCDALAAEATGGRERYARNLLRLASRMVRGRTAGEAHAIGIFDANTLERRVMRLTGKQMQMHGVRRLGVVVACVAFGVGTCGAALALRLNVGAGAAAGAAAASSARKVSGGVMQGNVVSQVPPVYPKAAKEAKIQGAVVLRAVIGTDGKVAELEAVSGPEELRSSAMDAVKQWIYKPYLLNGQPTEVETTVTVTYSLRP